MTDKLNRSPDMDELVRKALADDLPSDVEAGMRERIRRFRTDSSKGERTSTAWAWLSRRSVWAALSILVLVAGILLQEKKPATPLADRISSLKAAYASLEPTRR